MANIRFYHDAVPLEMHKAKIVQHIHLLPIEKRVEANRKAGNNAHLLRNEDVFLDMLTDSGVNAMSDQQLAAMMVADDAYAGSASYFRLEEKVREIFEMAYFLPAHQGRACEHLLSKVFVKPGMTVPMNYHFTTTKSHIELAGGQVKELVIEEGIKPESTCAFKGNMDIQKLQDLLQRTGSQNIPFVRIESGTNLIGGQPVSLENMRQVSQICKDNNIKLVLDASLLADNLYFMKVREPLCLDMPIKDIIREVGKCFDIVYFSARKLTCSRGGGICLRSREDYQLIRDLIPLYEGFPTYGGISVREIEAMAVGLEETLDLDIISQGPIFIEEMTKLLMEQQVPMVTPAGGLGVHIDCARFAPHIPQKEYPAGAVACALYLAGGIRGTERGTLSQDRTQSGEEEPADMELLRLALPRRVFTLSQVKYAVDRIGWLYENRELIGGLRFVDEPSVLRFFFGRLESVDAWQPRLVEKFRKDFGDSL